LGGGEKEEVDIMAEKRKGNLAGAEPGKKQGGRSSGLDIQKIKKLSNQAQQRRKDHRTRTEGMGRFLKEKWGRLVVHFTNYRERGLATLESLQRIGEKTKLVLKRVELRRKKRENGRKKREH